MEKDLSKYLIKKCGRKVNMKKYRLKFISILLCFTLLFTYNISTVLAAGNAAKQFSTVSAAENTSSQFKIIEDNDTVRTAMGEYQGDELRVTVNKLTDEITMQSIEKSRLDKITGLSLGKDTIRNYTVQADTVIKGGEVSATITDTKTQKVYKLKQSPNKVKAQAAILVPLVDILGAALLAFILASMAYIIVNNIKCVL